MRNSRGMLGFVLDRIEATKFRKNAAGCSLGGGSLLGCFFFLTNPRGFVGMSSVLGMVTSRCWAC